MPYLAQSLQQPSTVARTRRISALNYGFFARLCDLETKHMGGRLNGHVPSIGLLDYMRLPLLDPTQFAYTPAPSVAELVEQAAQESANHDAAPDGSRREAAIRKLVRNMRFVLEECQHASPTCARTLRLLRGARV